MGEHITTAEFFLLDKKNGIRTQVLAVIADGWDTRTYGLTDIGKKELMRLVKEYGQGNVVYQRDEASCWALTEGNGTDGTHPIEY